MARGDPLQFQADLRKFAKLIKVDLATVRKKITFDLLKKIIFKTPVDKGTLRANWFTSDGAMDPSTVPEGVRTGDSAANQSLSGNVTANFKDAFEATFITNNLPYVAKIEFDGHSSVKAPAGMVRVSLAELETELMSVRERLR